MTGNNRLSIAYYPGAVVYRDRAHTENGTPIRVATMSWAYLHLSRVRPGIPAELMAEIERHAGTLQRQRGELLAVMDGLVVRLGDRDACPSAALDGLCHNAEPGTYGHECGQPATWIGTTPDGYRTGFCVACKRGGYEARRCVAWEPMPAPREVR